MSATLLSILACIHLGEGRLDALYVQQTAAMRAGDLAAERELVPAIRTLTCDLALLRREKRDAARATGDSR